MPFRWRSKKALPLLLLFAVTSIGLLQLYQQSHRIFTYFENKYHICAPPKCVRGCSASSASSASSTSSPGANTPTFAPSRFRSNQNRLPCCEDVLFQMVLDLSIFFDAENIEYSLTFGTLLGAVRNQDIIPNTADLDIYIPSKEWARTERAMLRWTTHHKWGADRTYRFFFNDATQTTSMVTVTRICSMHTGAPWQLFHSVYMDDTTFTYADVYGDTDDEQDTFAPLMRPVTQVCMRGHSFSAPCYSTYYLEYVYGSDWRQPDHLSHGNSNTYPLNKEMEGANYCNPFKVQCAINKYAAIVNSQWRESFVPWLKQQKEKDFVGTNECQTSFSCKEEQGEPG